jgi:Tfp pilus assembly protein PilN
VNAPNQISFLPEDYLERKAQRRANFICAMLAGIVMAAIGSAFSLTEKVTRQVELRHAEVERQYADAARQIHQVEQVELKQKEMARQAELASSLLEKTPRSLILAEVTNSVPPDVSLLDFTLTSVRKSSTAPRPAPQQQPNGSPAPPAPAEPIAYDVTLRVSGVAGTDMQVAEFIRRLGHSALFKDVNLVISDEDTVDDEKVRKFQIEMNLAS